MLKKLSAIILVLLFLIYGLFFYSEERSCYVQKVISPTEIVLDNNKKFIIQDVETFDSFYSDRNQKLAEKFNMTEEEAFITGNLAKNWAANILEGRNVRLTNTDLIYNRLSYRIQFLNSAFCIKNGEPANKAAFAKHLKSIRKTKFVLLKDETGGFILIRKSHYYKIFGNEKKKTQEQGQFYIPDINLGNIKIVVSDMTTKLKPDRSCSAEICREILSNINQAKASIDIAIYGYSSVPEIEKALRNAMLRGVKIRLVYDVDAKGKNIYPDTLKLVNLIPEAVCDRTSKDVQNIMHNKFYIFDNKIVITGSANLSHTDMSGYNSNAIIIIKSAKAAGIYENEFEQIFNGKFHTDKIAAPDKTVDNMKIYFSPQDKTITTGIIPLIKESRKYIYIPAFLITSSGMCNELISAKQRGVDVKLIVDALNASGKYSKHQVLRDAGIPVKIENYAGKMHSKSVIVDDKYVAIGSMNFSRSGENKNDENLIIFNSPDAAKFYREFFLYQWNKIPDRWLKLNPRAESPDSTGSCDDGIDNDYDGFIDKEDPACSDYKRNR